MSGNRFRRVLGIALLLTAMPASWRWAAANPGPTDSVSCLEPFSIILHEEIRIQAEPEAIWPYLFQSRNWQTGVSAERRIAGGDDEVGRVIEVTYPNGNTIQVATIDKMAPHKAVFQIFDAKGGLKGFSMYTLLPVSGMTILQYDVIMKAVSPGQDEDNRRYADAMSTRLKKNLAKLKELVSNR